MIADPVAFRERLMLPIKLRGTGRVAHPA